MAEGQYSGKTAIYVYKSDDGTEYLVRLDKTLGDLSQLGMQKAVQSDLTKPTLPKNFTPRKVLWEGEVGGEVKTKRLTANPEATAYKAKGSTKFEIDGSTKGGTTGRVGEKQTFLRLKEETPVAP